MKRNLLTLALCLISAICAMAQAESEPQPSKIVSVEPAAGVVESLNHVSIIFSAPAKANDECTETAKFYYGDNVMVEFNNKNRAIQYPIDREDPNSVNLILAWRQNEFFTASGDYHFVLPEGFFLLNGEPSPALDVKYTIPNKLAYKLTPRPGTVDEISEFTLVFPEAVSITRNKLEVDADGDGDICFIGMEYSYIDEAGATKETAYCYPEEEISGNTVKFRLYKQDFGKDPEYLTATAPGNYFFVVPFGAFTVETADGTVMTNPQIDAIYAIASFPAPTIDPAPGEVFSTDVESLYLTLPEGLTFGMWMGAMNLFKVDEEGIPVGKSLGTWRLEKGTSAAGQKEICLMATEEYDIPTGNYAFKLGKSTYSVNATPESGYPSEFNGTDTYYYYTIYNPASGVDEVAPAADETYDVYTTQGVLVARDRTRAAVNALPAGLYLLRGTRTSSKVMVK